MTIPDILILGGGIIGCSLARELARVAGRVVVLEQGRAGAAASSAAAGLLTPTFEAGVGPLVDLAYDSTAIYESWVEELQADGAGDVGYRRAGLLTIAMRPEEAERIRCYAQVADPRRPAEWLDSAELRRKEPALSPHVQGAVWYPQDAQVHPVLLSRAVARAAELAGVRIHENERVVRLERAGDRISRVQTATATYEAGLVIVTAGAWSGGLLEPLGIHLPTRPVKGQLMQADCRVSPVQTPMHAGEALLIPRPDGSLVLGVTVEEAGFDDTVTLDGMHTIMERTMALVPALSGLAFAHAWAGLRPATPDDLPYMGPVPPCRNLWVSVGHFRKGIMLAPLCARLLASSILANHLHEDLEPFKPTRRLADGLASV